MLYAAAGITVMPTSEHADVLENYALIEALIEMQAWGIASDVLRFSIIEHFGGVYSDLNYVFERDLEDAVYHYDFFAKEYFVGGMPTNNCFLAAKPKHPILKRVTELVARNFGPDKPAYVAESYDPYAPSFTTVNPLWIAYYQKAHEEGTLDVLFPKFSTEDDRPGSVALTEYNSGDGYIDKDDEVLQDFLN